MSRGDAAHLRRLWRFARPYRRSFALAFGLLALSFGVELAGPWLIRAAIDGPVADAAHGGALDGLGGIAAAYLGLVLLGSALGYAFAVTTARAGKSAIRDLRCALHAHLLRVDARWHDRHASGRVVTRLTTDVDNLDQLVTTGALHALFDTTKLLGIALALALFVPAVLGLALGALPVAAGIAFAFRARARRAYGRVRGVLAAQNALTAELVQGVRTIRAFGQEELVDARYDERNAATRDAWDDTVRCFASFFATVDLSLRLVQAGLLLLGGRAVAAGAATPGALVQGWLYFQKLTGPIRDLGERYNVLQSALSSAERIQQILDEPSGPHDAPDARVSRRGPARVELRGVRFGYRPDQPVLRGVDLAVQPGETCAIVGPTGAGKTTLLALLSRLHDVDAGEILLDGVPVRALTLASLRARVAVVPQEPVLFTGTVLDNVRLFDPDVDPDRVRAVLEELGALALIDERGGLELRLGEGAATLSRGERQLLGLARALVADPDLLVLDEATANVDSATEARVQRALRTLRRDRTVIVVAHRLATVRDADRIVVLDAGRVAEAGTHRELAAADGPYAAMLGRARRG